MENVTEFDECEPRPVEVGGQLVVPERRSLELMWQKVLVTSSCWLWIGACDGRGYGHAALKADGRRRDMNAHRLVYQLLVGPVAPGMQLDHLCQVRNCVNPDHLEPVTPSANVRRGSRRRGSKVERCELAGHRIRIRRNGTRMCMDCENEYQRARASRMGGWGSKATLAARSGRASANDDVGGLTGAASRKQPPQP